jgi:hypothetical protein
MGVVVDDDVFGQVDPEPLDHHSPSWGVRSSSGLEFRSREVRGRDSSIRQDAWDIKKSSKRR